MIRTFDGSYGGRNDYAKYTLTSYNENRESGFFCKYSSVKADKFWPGASLGHETTNIRAGHHNAADGNDKWYWCGVTFPFEELAELRGKDVKAVRLELEATLESRVDVDMKKNEATQDMARCDKDGNAIDHTLLGKWSADSPNYVSREEGICVFDLTNDTKGSFAGVPRYGYCWGRNVSDGPSYYTDINDNESALTTEKRAKLYVVTSERQAVLSFDAQGGSGAPGSVTGTGPEGACAVKIPEAVPTLSEKTFRGWAKTAGGEAAYQPGDTVSLSGNKTLYAVWADRFVYLRYLPGAGGTGSFSVLTRPETELTVVDVSAHLKKEGKQIAGYADTDGGAKAYDTGDRITMGEEDRTIYALWEPAVYTISYHANGGSGAPSPQTKNYGTPVTLSGTVPAKAGYEFRGWALSAGGAAVYFPGDTYIEEESRTLYAVWEEFGSVIHYAAHGGIKAAKVYVQTADGIKRARVFVQTENGLKEGR